MKKAQMINRRQLLNTAGLGVAASVLGMPFTSGILAKPADKGLSVMATGQSLIEHDLRRFSDPALVGIRHMVSDADIAVTDMDVAIRGTGPAKPTRDDLFFHAASEQVVQCLKYIGFDMLTLANNHIWDLGAAGILAARDAVEKAGMQATGAGATIKQASQPAFTNGSAGKVALVAMATGKLPPDSIATMDRAGVNALTVESDGTIPTGDVHRNIRAIQVAVEAGALVIVCHHNHEWERDLQTTPDWQRAWARSCIDAGAAMYVSHGALMLHGMEIYNGRPIFYGLGNFIFHTRTESGFYPSIVWESVLAECHFIEGKCREIRLQPIMLNEEGEKGDHYFATRGCPAIADGHDARRIISRLASLSVQYGLTIEMDGDQGVIYPG